MAFVSQYDRGKLQIMEPVIRRVVWTDLLNLTADDDPLDPQFLEYIADFGYIQMGTIVLDLPSTEAEFRTGTPNRLVARALTQRDWQWNMTPAQWTPDIREQLWRLLTETGSSQTLSWVGPDIPPLNPFGLLAKGKTYDGVLTYAAMFYGLPMLEGIQIAFSGTEFTGTPIVIQGQEHPDFAADPWDLTSTTKSYGLIWQVEDES